VKTLHQEALTESLLSTHTESETAAPTTDTVPPRDLPDAHRAALLAAERALVANWVDARPRIAVVERKGIDTVYVSTAVRLDPVVRADIRGAVRSALAPFAKLAPYTNVIFLTRGNR
jgi:hypothetical protein